MLLTATQGVVLNALLSLGFQCTQNDLSSARLQRVERPYLIKVEVTKQLFEDPCDPVVYVPPVGLTSPLAWLSHQLSQVNCFFVPELSDVDRQEAVFVRQDNIRDPLLGPVWMRARVRATFERARS